MRQVPPLPKLLLRRIGWGGVTQARTLADERTVGRTRMVRVPRPPQAVPPASSRFSSRNFNPGTAGGVEQIRYSTVPGTQWYPRRIRFLDWQESDMALMRPTGTGRRMNPKPRWRKALPGTQVQLNVQTYGRGRG